MPTRRQLCWLAGCLAFGPLLSCGRTLVYDCQLAVSPAALDFGSAAPGQSVTQTLTLASLENGTCHVSALGFGAGTDPGFTLAPGALTAFDISSGQSATVEVTFETASAAPSAARTGTLTFATGDLLHPSASVPLSAHVPQCTLAVAPAAVDFGAVTLNAPVTQTVTLTDEGDLPCAVSAVALSASADPGFSLGAQATTLTVAPDAGATITVTFDATDSSAPVERKGALTFATGDPKTPSADVPLSATLPQCQLAVSPPTLPFGNVPLNGTRTEAVTVSNDGGLPCDVSAVALASGSDPDFSLPTSAPTAFTVDPGQSALVPVDFADLDGAAAPLSHVGTLVFQTGDLASPSAAIPLSAYINTSCVQGGQAIYTIDVDGTLSSFHPETLAFDDLGVISCPTTAPGDTPFSMAVDQAGTAFVLFNSGAIFQVDTLTAACQATGFISDQDGLLQFGMAFVFDPGSNTDTLYVAGGTNVESNNQLASIAVPSLVLTPIGQLAISGVDMTGTGDGELWGFEPSAENPLLAEIDTQNGLLVASDPLPGLAGDPTDWAVGFYGGAFYLFLAADGQSTQVFAVQRSDGSLTQVLNATGRHIVGAGVSTCAPLQ